MRKKEYCASPIGSVGAHDKFPPWQHKRDSVPVRERMMDRRVQRKTDK